MSVGGDASAGGFVGSSEPLASVAEVDMLQFMCIEWEVLFDGMKMDKF